MHYFIVSIAFLSSHLDFFLRISKTEINRREHDWRKAAENVQCRGKDVGEREKQPGDRRGKENRKC